MFGKITKGSGFRGCVEYVTRKKKDGPDGTPCDEWRLIDSGSIGREEDREEIIRSFEDNRSLNPRVKNPVGHISLNFDAEDADRLDDALMVEIAGKYMERMGIVDTPYIIVRHFDKAHPHCHIVFSRIDNHAGTISDKNDYERNKDICKDLTREYNLKISEGKEKTNVNRLRSAEKVKYRLFHIINGAWNNPGVNSWERFEKWLRAGGVSVEYKYRKGTSIREGVSFIYEGRKFSGSKVDRNFRFGNLDRHFTELQKASTRVSSGQTRRQPEVQQPAVTVGVSNIDTSPVEEQGWSCGGDNETWPEFRARHPDLSPKEALRRFHAKKRGSNINGGFHL